MAAMRGHHGPSRTTSSRAGLLLPEARRRQLAQLIQRQGEIRLRAAAQELGVSEMTARRDLDVLQVMGVARRVHGGAVAVLPTEFGGRAERAAAAKLVIAGKLLELLPERGAFVLDASSTVAALAAKLPDRGDIAVFTNGVDTFNILARNRQLSVHVLAGVYDPRTTNLVGPLTLRSLESLYFDVAVMSCAGLDVGWGATEATLEDAAVKQRMLEASGRKILAVDRSKLGLRGRARLAPIRAFDVLVTELDPNHEDLDEYRAFVEIR
jgi:DeoR family transcriptional regulator, fructose operon transcriptional repressor